MALPPRIGVRIGPADPYWVQLREIVWNALRECGAEPYEIDLSYARAVRPEDQQSWVRALLGYQLDALIVAYMPDPLAQLVLAHGLPIVHLTESALADPRCTTASGYDRLAHELASFVATQIAGRGDVLVAGGVLAHYGEDGRSRLDAIALELDAHPAIRRIHIPSAWRYDRALTQISAVLRGRTTPFAAIIGLSDSVALAARDAARAAGLIDPTTCIVGINGDPLALAAIADGSMTATMNTEPELFGAAAAAAAVGAARGEPLAAHLVYRGQLVTREQVRAVAGERMLALARLPSYLVGVRQRTTRVAQTPPARVGAAVLVQRAIAYIHQHFARDLTRHEIAAHVGVSENYLTQIFTRETRQSPWEYLNTHRIDRARELLRNTPASVTAVAQEVGFDDPAYFSRVFRRIVGVSPRRFRLAEPERYKMTE